MKQSWRQFLDRTARATESGGTENEAVITATRFHLDHHRSGKTNEFVIIGLGRFGTSVAETLVNYGHNVLAIDQDLDRVRALSTTLPHVMQLNATNIDALRQAGVDSFSTGLVCIGSDFESNILATVLLRRLGVEHVIAKARTRTQREILLQVGVDEVILPEHEAGVRLARRLAAGHFIDYLEVADDVGIVELIAPHSFWERTLAECNLRQRYGLTAIAVRRADELIVSPSAAFRIESNDILVVLGKLEDAERLAR
ncbi:MAG TPA: TrkA family potassium uptake protein [Caldilineaceae bacterium]|nr:TrkA family potassium uptake protein [Caldilineaceae bacterium]